MPVASTFHTQRHFLMISYSVQTVYIARAISDRDWRPPEVFGFDSTVRAAAISPKRFGNISRVWYWHPVTRNEASSFVDGVTFVAEVSKSESWDPQTNDPSSSFPGESDDMNSSERMATGDKRPCTESSSMKGVSPNFSTVFDIFASSS